VKQEIGHHNMLIIIFLLTFCGPTVNNNEEWESPVCLYLGELNHLDFMSIGLN
jgi:hypothetical protein